MARTEDDDITVVTANSRLKETADSTTRNCPKCGLAVAESTNVCPQDGTQIFSIQEEFLAERYEFLTVTGSGGMSVVYKARRSDNGEIVAIKMLHSLLMNEQSMRRFQQEARAITSLKHPNIINVHDFGVSEHGQPYMVMDFIEGDTLADLIREKGGLSVEESLHRFIQLCDALQHAHQKGVLHRDLKPSNIMVSNRDGSFADARIVDFGIAKLLDKEDDVDHDGTLTRTGELFGSPLYMSPEQCRGTKVDARTDIYSMGCVMYETLTGSPPLRGESIIETFIMQMNENPPALSQVCPDKNFPPQLEAVIAQAMAKNPDERFQTMRDLENALMEIQPNQNNAAAIRPRKVIAMPSVSKPLAACVIACVAGYLAARVNTPEQATSFSQAKLVDLATKIRLIRKNSNEQEVLDALKDGDIGMTRIMLNKSRVLSDVSGRRLAVLKSASEINLDTNRRITDETLKALGTLPALRTLSLRMTSVTDRGVEFLEPLKTKLEYLNITNTAVSGKGIRFIANNFKNLKGLAVSRLNFKPEDAIALSGLKLQVFYAHLTSVNDDVVKAMAEGCDLIALELNGTKVTDVGLVNLPQMRSLQKLGLIRLNISDNGVKALSQLNDLRVLQLSKNLNVTDISASALASMRTLQTLELEGTGISDAGVLSLSVLPNLLTLNLSKDKISDTALTYLTHSKKLQNLDLSYTKITDQGLKRLGQLQSLKTLTVIGCPNITIDGIDQIIKDLPGLQVNLIPSSSPPSEDDVESDEER